MCRFSRAVRQGGARCLLWDDGGAARARGGPALEAVKDKLDQPLTLGYCNVGVVAGLGARVEGFAVGDRVVSNGKHAEVVCVPKNLCTEVPEGVSDDEATFTVIAAIGLQGIRHFQSK